MNERRRIREHRVEKDSLFAATCTGDSAVDDGDGGCNDDDDRSRCATIPPPSRRTTNRPITWALDAWY